MEGRGGKSITVSRGSLVVITSKVARKAATRLVGSF